MISFSKSPLSENISPGLLRRRVVQDLLAGDLDTAIDYTLADGKKGTLLISSPEEIRIGGGTSSRQSYLITLGTKILGNGTFVDSRKIGGEYSFKLENCYQKKDWRGKQEPFEVELVFDKPEKSVIKIYGDGKVVVRGDIDVRLHTAGKILRDDGEIEQGALPAGSRRFLTLEEVAIEDTNRIMRSDPDQPITDFSNTIVALWCHVEEMVSCLEAQIEKGLQQHRGSVLNFLMEKIGQNEFDRFKMAIDFDSALRNGNSSLDLSCLDRQGHLCAQSMLHLAQRFAMKVQIYPVDTTHEGENTKLRNDWKNAQRKFINAALRRRSFADGDRALKAAENYVFAEGAYCSEREELVAEQMQRFCLTPAEDGINVLAVGRAHAPILNSLPGAKAVYATIPLYLREVLGPKKFDSLNAHSLSRYRMRQAYDQARHLPIHDLRLMVLEVVVHEHLFKLAEKASNRCTDLAANGIDVELIKLAAETAVDNFTKAYARDLFNDYYSANRRRDFFSDYLNSTREKLGVQAADGPAVYLQAFCENALDLKPGWIARLETFAPKHEESVLESAPEDLRSLTSLLF